MAENENHIYLSDEEMSQAIDKAFTKEGKLVKEAIIGLLNNSKHAMNVVFKASLGISPKHAYAHGDTVAVNSTALPTWKADIDKMIEAGIVYPHPTINDKMIFNATIKELKHWDEYPYVLLITIIDEHGTETTDTSTVREEYIIGHTEEWPEL